MRNFVLFTACLLSIALLPACGAEQPVAEQRHQYLATTQDAVKVAVVWPFTAGGTLFREGVQMAVDEINGGGSRGIGGRKLQVVQYDDHSSVTEGMAAAQAIAADPAILAVVGHRNSFVALPAAEVYHRAGLLYIAPSPTNPDLTRRGYQLTFRTIPSDITIARQMAEYIAAQGFRRLALIYADDAYGRGLADSFEDAAEALGVQVVDRLSHFGDAQTATQTINKWQAFDYDSIFVADVLPGAAEVIARLRQTGADKPIFGGDGLDGDQLWLVAGSAAEGVILGSVFDSSDPDPRVQRFVKAFERLYGVTPDAWAAQGYDAIHLLAAGAAVADEITPAGVATALRDITGWTGVTGVHRFDPTGELVGKPVVRKILRAGHLQFLGK